MKNGNRFLVGINVEVFGGPASETKGWIAILDRAIESHVAAVSPQCPG